MHGTNFHCYSEHAIDSNWPWLISVGDNVMISTDVKLLGHDASMGYGNGKTKVGIMKIGSDVFIGANSVVTHDLPGNGVYGGNPAKLMCTMDEFKKHSMNLKSHEIFTSRKWDTWVDATPEEWEQMRQDLEDTFGYL